MSIKRIAIIPARSGSKGLKNKNILNCAGKPLFAWTLEAAQSSGLFEKIIFSTDSQEYATLAKNFGADVPFLRDLNSSLDDSSLMSVVKEVDMHLKASSECYDSYTVLQPTSPLRNCVHIREAIELFESLNSPLSLASVYEVDPKFNWLLTEDGDGYISFLNTSFNKSKSFSRQKNKNIYMPNGAIFIFSSRYIEFQYTDRTYPYIMDKFYSVDVDTEDDFLLAETRLLQNINYST